MELDSVHERVLVDRTGVRSAPAQRLAVGLAGPSDVRRGDRREWEQLAGVDLDLTKADPVTAALLNPLPPPESDRERDIPRQDVVAQLTAELHALDASGRSSLISRYTDLHVPYEDYGGALGSSPSAKLDPIWTRSLRSFARSGPRKSKSPLARGGFCIAGAGFEPATFGL